MQFAIGFGWVLNFLMGAFADASIGDIDRFNCWGAFWTASLEASLSISSHLLDRRVSK